MAYRILSLDGGGVWALIQVEALIAMHPAGVEAKGRSVLAEYDLVAANSGGSIVLGALLEDLTLGEIRGLFQSQAQRGALFPKCEILGDRVLRDVLGFGPKYSAHDKLPAVQKALPKRGGATLAQVVAGLRRAGSAADLHVLITAFDYDSNRAVFFRSAPIDKPGWGEGASTNVTLAEAIHACTNAPVNYFDSPAVFPNSAARYWDGAVAGYNNPVMGAVVEAIGKGQAPETLAALSLGTGSVVLPPPPQGAASSPYYEPLIKSDLKNDLEKLASAILDDPPDAATFLAHVATGCGAGVREPADSRVVRMNPLVSPVFAAGAWGAPGGLTAEQFSYLANVPMDALAQEQVTAITQYAALWLADKVPNQPIRMNGATLARELGQSLFTQALAAWRAIA